MVETKNFYTEYQKLCEKYNAQLIVEPLWVRRDDGTYSMALQFKLQELPLQKQKEE